MLQAERQNKAASNAKREIFFIIVNNCVCLKLLYEGVIEEEFISDIVHAACSLCNIPFLIERASLGASSRQQKYENEIVGV